MLNFLESKDDADLFFNVRGTEVLAHSHILKATAPIRASCGTVVNMTRCTGGRGLNTTGDTAKIVEGM
jgi:hypothetical protein